MANTLDDTGLTIDTLTDITNKLTTAYQGIYGSDINLSSNSPDGQTLNIYAQIVDDILTVIQDVFTSFDPDQAQGLVLRQRCAINGVIDKGASYTIVPIDITTTQTVTLSGLDSAYNDANGTGYTISDNAGNNYILLNSVTLNAGVTTCSFRAQNIGALDVELNTINTQTTPVLGISSVNNSAAPSQNGQDEESDTQLRTRRALSTNNPAKGFLESIQGNILALTNVTACIPYQNKSLDTDNNGIPAKSVYIIVEGGDDSEIANIIYNNVSDGSNFYGSTTVNITEPAGTILPVSFQRPVDVPLYIQFNIKTTIPGTTFNSTNIKNYIIDNLSYTISQYAETTAIANVANDAIANTTGGGIALNPLISLDNIVWTDFINTPTLASQFTLNVNNITINMD